MKIFESWKRNSPDTISGESITVTITYSSFDKLEIDDFESTLPKGATMMKVDNPIKLTKKPDENKLKDICRVLFNRCRAVGSFNGELCSHCELKNECDEMHSI